MVEPCPKCSTLLRPGELHACVARPPPSGKTVDDMVQAIVDRFSKAEEVAALEPEDAGKLISASAAFKVAQARGSGEGGGDLSAFQAWLHEPPVPPERQLEDAYRSPELDDHDEAKPVPAGHDAREADEGGEGSPDPEPRASDRSTRLVLVGRRTVPSTGR